MQGYAQKAAQNYAELCELCHNQPRNMHRLQILSVMIGVNCLVTSSKHSDENADRQYNIIPIQDSLVEDKGRG